MEERLKRILWESKGGSRDMDELHKELCWLFNEKVEENLNNFVDFYNDRQIRSDWICNDEVEIYTDSISTSGKELKY